MGGADQERHGMAECVRPSQQQFTLSENQGKQIFKDKHGRQHELWKHENAVGIELFTPLHSVSKTQF